jgi:putative ABC transport system permease protein
VSGLVAKLRGWWHRLRFLFGHRRQLTEFDEELRFHTELRAAEFAAAGMSAGAARRAALRQVGDPIRWREEMVGVLAFAWWESLLQDARFALRSLRTGGLATITAVLSLGLGLGAVLAVLTLVHLLVLRPARYPDADRLVVAYQSFTPGFMTAADTMPMRLGRFMELQPLVPSFRSSGFGSWDEANLDNGGSAERIRIGVTTAGLFTALGVAPALGRVHTVAEDADGALVAVVSAGFWRSRLNGSRAAIGTHITVAGSRFTVIGVMPRGFRGLADGSVLWIPARALDRLPAGATVRFDDAQRAIGNVIVRLPAGMSIAQAAQQLRQVLSTLPAPPLPPGRTVTTGLVPLNRALQHPLVLPILKLLGLAVSAVLLIVCANVVALLLARLRARRLELAVRASLGAGRARLLRQLQVEGVMLALFGGVPALLLGYIGARALAQMRPALPDPFVLLRGSDVLADATLLPGGFVLVSAVLLIFGVGSAIGLVSAFAAPRGSPGAALQTGGGYTHTWRATGRNALVVTQVALATLLLVCAGLTLRSLRALMTAELGYRTEHVVVAQLAAGNATTVARRVDLLERLRIIPGVAGVATAYSTPFMPEVIRRTRIDRIDGRELEGELPWFEGHQVSRDYFRVLDIPLRAGADFDSDGQGQGVLINETAARLLWRGVNPVGHSIGGGDEEAPRTILGVVADARYQAVKTAPAPAIFEVMEPAARPGNVVTLFIRSERDPQGLLTSLRRELAHIEPGTALFDAATMQQRVRTATGANRYVSWLLLGFSGVAALLAAIGVYGVLAYAVAQRRRELGVRLALGATPVALLAGVMRQGTQLVAAGIVLGLLAAVASARIMGAFLYGIGAHDPWTFAAAALLLGAIGVVATLLPARRAGAVDPTLVLRE